ncbi:MAG: integrin alpha, partial [Planctomycetota bacterium]
MPIVERLEPRQLLAGTTIDLAALTAAQGTTIFGADAADNSGFSVSSAGDVNGDGFDDLLVGAIGADASGNAKSSAGDSYLIFGSASPPATIDLATLGSAGVTIFGADSGDNSGFSVSNAGDVNGDGFDDLLVGAWAGDASGNAKLQAGDGYLIFGGASLPTTIDLASLGTAGITFFGADADDDSGRSVSSAGDVNGDGFDDIIICGYQADGVGNTKSNSGESYVIFGGSSLPSIIDFATPGAAGITIFGADNGDGSGRQVSAADVNGDGFDDLLIGAVRADASGNAKLNAGDSYVIFGGASLPTTIDLGSLGAAGITIFGAETDDYSGRSISTAGDVNGDGFNDLLIGAYRADASGNAKASAGDSYLIFGGAALPATIDLAALGSAGITIFGAAASDSSGISVRKAGDVNGDGFDDLLIGAWTADASGNAKLDAGESYLIFGGTSLPATIDLATLGSTGVILFGADASDRSGFGVSGAGDVNGDGFDDLLIGAYRADASGNAKADAGESYLIFGGNGFTTSVTHLGTATGETLTGTASGNVMNGSGGNDTVIGGGGTDVLLGGQGNDLLAISDLSFKRIVGGTGSDTLRLDGSGLSLNLTKLADNRLVGIEQIDIRGNGSNTLTLSAREVLNLSDESNTLVVQANADDRVVLGAGWSQRRDETIGGIRYSVLTNGSATLKVSSVVSLLPPTIDLGSIGAAGIAIFGADAVDRSGYSVSSAGDVNGDGFDDLLIGAFFGDASGNSKSLAGDSYVVFGGATLPATIDLANLGSAGITIYGVDASDYSGLSVSGAGDVNGDGFDDLIVGAPSADASGNAKSNAGDSYVIFGGAALPSTIDLASLGTAGITISGADAGDGSGLSVSSAGDVNGDGFDDLLVGAIYADASSNGKSNAGDSYVIFGGAALPATIDLATLGSAGVTIFGADASDSSGRSVSSAGDVNGDGFDDLLIGANKADASGNAKSNAVDSYVIFGGAALPPTIDLASLGSAGVTIFGADAGDGGGVSVSNAGDVNGDGYDDILIGAAGADASGNAKTSAGDSYVIFGGAALPATINLASLGSAGITIFGGDAGDSSGQSVSSAGDVNGDGFDDLIIGAFYGDAAGNAKTSAGDSYLIFGGASLPTTIDLATLAFAGISIFGADAGDFSGYSVSGAGDVNGDGFDDLLIGAGWGDAAGNIKTDAGESYVIFGGNGFTGAVTHLGTAAGETLTGTASASVMSGGRGNDTLIGSGGADVLIGGQGSDILAVGDLSFKRIVGGTGSDVLRLDGSGLSLNLTVLADNRLLGIEQIDITGSGNNTLTLSLREVLNISDESNTLIVRRSADDVVNIGSGWTQGANQMIGLDTFQVFTQGAAILKVQITVNAAPVIGGFDATISYTEGDAPLLLDTDATVSDADSANFDTGALTVTLTANAESTDRLEIRNQGEGVGQIGVSGG